VVLIFLRYAIDSTARLPPQSPVPFLIIATYVAMGISWGQQERERSFNVWA
jgi:hypothetical protein